MLALSLLAEAVARGAGPRTQRLCHTMAVAHRSSADAATRKAALEALVTLASHDAVTDDLRPLLAADPDPEVRSEYWARLDIAAGDFAAYLRGEKATKAIAALLQAPHMTADLLAEAAPEMTKTLATALVEHRRCATVAAVLPDAVTFLARPWKATMQPSTNPLGSAASRPKIGRIGGEVLTAATYHLGGHALAVADDDTLPAWLRLAALASAHVSAAEADARFGDLLERADAEFGALRNDLQSEERNLISDALECVAARTELPPTAAAQFDARVDGSVVLRFLAHDWRIRLDARHREETVVQEDTGSLADARVDGRPLSDWLDDEDVTHAVLAGLWSKLDAETKDYWWDEFVAADSCDAALYRTIAAETDQDVTDLLARPGDQLWVQDEALFRELVPLNAAKMLEAVTRLQRSGGAPGTKTAAMLRWLVEAFAAGTVELTDKDPNRLWIMTARNAQFPQDLFRLVPAAAAVSMIAAGTATDWMMEQVLAGLENIEVDPKVSARLLEQLITDDAPLGATLEAVTQAVA